MAQPVLPDGFQEEAVMTGRANPTAVRFASNGQVFLAEKSGLIWAYDGVDDPTPTLVIDLRPKVHNFWDRGLLGLAVAPGYPDTPHLYVLYAHDVYPDGSGPRWGSGLPNPSTDDPCPSPPGPTADGCVVFGQLSRVVINLQSMQGTEVPLIGAESPLPATRWAWCQQYPSHSTGDLYFGQDGYLYASAGDGASFNFADWGQDGDPLNPCDDPPAGDGDLSNGTGTSNTGSTAAGGALRSQDIITTSDPVSFDGSILRIDVSADPVQAPADNPLVGNGVAGDDLIIATGLRNPFRITGRPGTAEIWVADVGWNTWEELNRIIDPAGTVENFGWPCYEGGDTGSSQQASYDQQTLCQTVYNNPPAGIVTTAPFWAYRHSDKVVAGELCGTGSSSVTGVAFNTGTAYPLDYDNALFFADSSRMCVWTMFAGAGGAPDRNNRLALVSQSAGRIVDLQMGPDDHLYYVDFDGGRVVRINYFGVNAPPVAVVTADVTSGPAPLTVALDGSGSSDPEDGTDLQYAWELDGDGQFDDAYEAAVVWTYDHAGVFVAELRVQDTRGAMGTAAITITAGNTAPVPVILSPTPATDWAVGDVLNLAGEASDEQDGVLPGERLTWEMILHHCYSLEDCHTHPLTSIPGTATAEFETVDHEYPAFLEIRLTAEDLPPPDWYDAAWEKRRRLTVYNSGQTESFTGVPLLVVLDPSRIDYDQVTADGRDLRFTDAAGNLLPYEIESWVPYGTSHVWVSSPLIPAASTGTTLFMYYGNPLAVGGAENPAALWGAYRGVWHLHESAEDASGNLNHGTAIATTDIAGAIGLAKHFNGTSAYINVADSASLRITGPLTIEAWIRIDDPAQAGAPRVLSKKPVWNAGEGYNLEYKPGENNVTSLGSGDNYLRADNVDLDTGWHHLTAVHQGTGAGSIYVDGISLGTDLTASELIAGSNLLRIGAAADASAGSRFLGSIDEVRLANLARSSEWQRASFLAMTDSLLTYGAEEQLTTLSASTSVMVYPRIADVTLATDPPGLELTIGSVTAAAPFTTTVIVNSDHTVEAPAPQALGGTDYTFTAWDDGGAQVHTITVPESGLTLTAQFAEPEPDTDADGVGDSVDNCTAVANGPVIPDAGGNSQRDTDGDGYGNVCDADLNQDGNVNFADLALFRAVFGTADPDADLNGSGGSVNAGDLAIFRALFGRPPGPSGLVP
jgi:glucose/arabinose dehydrogenase/PKD repeat protein